MIYDLVVIGGGSGGLSAAISAFDHGVKNILVLEKEDYLGGIFFTINDLFFRNI